MEHPLVGTFGCESIEALAWHISHCHWMLDFIPQGLIEDLQFYERMTAGALQSLRDKYVQCFPAR